MEEGSRKAEPTDVEDVKRRATGGATLLVARAALIVVVGLAANIVLARFLVPRDFGLIAIGTVLITLAGYLGDGGFGAALIRRADPPTRAELAAVNALQLTATMALTLVAIAGAAAFGRDGAVIALMVASLPITVLRAPSVIVLERRLSYRGVATADVTEAAAFYVFAVVTVVAGAGVWGMASAMIVRAVVGTVVMIRVGPLGLVPPRWSWSRLRPLVGFGLKLQAISAVTIARDQGMNIAVAAIAGVGTLGIWNLAFRVLQIPMILFITIGRVSFASISRLLSSGADPRSAIERGLSTLVVLSGVLLAAIAGFAPGLPDVVGHAWDDVPPTLAWSCLALLLNAPVYVMTVGYLYAVDRAKAVLWAMVAYSLVWLGLTLPLLPSLGAPAIALGWIGGSIAATALLERPTARLSGASILGNLLPPAAPAILGGVAGWCTATAAHGTALAGGVGALTAELVLFAALALVRRRLLVASYALVVDAIRGMAAARPAGSI